MNDWPSAVNMIFIEDEIIFIQRSESMPSHKGQLGFFGGHKQEGELEPQTTAYREFCEESGIQSSELEFAGLVEPVFTSNNYFIVPVMSHYKKDRETFFTAVKSNGEWSNLFAVKLSYLQNSDNWQKSHYCDNSKNYEVYYCPLLEQYTRRLNPLVTVELPILWGASAKMTWNLFKNNF